MKHVLLTLLLFLLTTCNSDHPESQVIVTRVNETKMSGLIENRNGNVLVVNVWATWCVPCREEFPDLIELRQLYPKNILDMVGISADYIDETDTKIIPFLKEQKANFQNYVQNFPKQEDFINFMNPDWNGALPVTFIYDETGKQRSFLQGKQSFDELKMAVDKVVNN